MDDLQRIGIVFAVNVAKKSSKLDDPSRDSNAISLSHFETAMVLHRSIRE